MGGIKQAVEVEQVPMAATLTSLNISDQNAMVDADSGAESEDEGNAARPTAGRDRRRAQKMIFETWLTSDAGKIALAKKKEYRSVDTADEIASIHSLMERSTTQIIKNPREYQTELFERAKKENTIAVLDTGSGKTLISVLLLRWIVDQELEDRANHKEPRISFFLVVSVTLAYQQQSVLETNLDHKVARVCGADNIDSWSKAQWLKLFTDNKVIICTAEVLCQCLSRGFIAMRQINLLIFDEAHHAKKNHAYARILKESYFPAENHERPRIFGMTASPIDGKSDVDQAATELETILDARIATTLDMSLVDAVKKPTEQVQTYAALSRPLASPLLQACNNRYSHITVFHRSVQKWQLLARELGYWCADQYLIDKLSERRLRRFESAAEQRFHARSQNNDISELDDELAELRSAIAFVQSEGLKIATAEINATTLSSKVLELHKYLKGHFERPTSQRCIVFVDRRDTARLLHKTFQKIGSQHMLSAFLIGGNEDVDEDHFSFRQQVMTLMKFRKGEVNCMFATSVAEEGLDVPDCNLVIRFDIAKTMIHYVQSRGRARKQNSKFLHLMENGNSIHTELVSSVRYHEVAMRRFCQTLPEDRRLVGNEDSLEELMGNEKKTRQYLEPTTGAKLTYGNALVCLANYVSVTTAESEEPQHPTYVVASRGLKFICEVLLPGDGVIPLRSKTGRECTKKALAKRSAAFDACIELRRLGHLDEHLVPTYRKRLHAMRNAHLAVNEKKSKQYAKRVKPTAWENERDTLPEELWVTIIDFPDGLESPHQPFAFLTRTKMPDFPAFPIFLDDGCESKVVPQQLQRKLAIDESKLARLSAFTFRVFKDVFSKTYEEEAASLSYWMAPILSTASGHNDMGIVDIDWALLEEVFNSEQLIWTPDMPQEELLHRFMVDRWDGARKFYSTAIETSLTPFDPLPEDAARHKKDMFNEHILSYSVSLWKKSRARAEWNPNQPVVRAVKLSVRRNRLATGTSKEEDSNTRAYLCPEPLKISLLPPPIVESCLMWPSIIHRFEAHMIAQEAVDLTGVHCKPSLALAAITKDSDNTGEHGQEPVNFMKGMGENYERLEFIGDTFLKTATTISTFIQNPNDNEFDFHVKRMLLLCNKNLFNNALELKLYEYIRSDAFNRRTWYPEGLKLLSGTGAGSTIKERAPEHPLSDKTIADVCEALIGAAFLTHDRPGEKWQEDQWQDAICAVSKLTSSATSTDPTFPRHDMVQWNDYRTAYEKPGYQMGEVTASQRDLAEKIQLEHAYQFKYPRLLRSAFIHPSQPFSFEKLPNYQRLEFLGDALLDMASISHIFYRFPDKDPQWLTEHKMAMVSNKFLGAVCVNIGFYKHLRHHSSIMEHQIAEYVAELLEAKRTASESRDYWTTVSDPPKCLPDIVESFVGAMFIDSDFDYNVVQDFFDAHMKWYFEDMSIYDTFANNHPCTHLHNLLQTTYGCQDYGLMAKEISAAEGAELDRQDIVAGVVIHDKVVAWSKGKSGRYARVRAAQNAIEAVEGLAPFEFRSRFDCACDKKAEVESVADCSA